ncbi:hypothetical protein LCGC14_2629830 [marine sediment metagenome]|uniref:Winged helix DNA-binding domain-containing protein n=1 Tax=marine sediment metagenome TaxID=412755 RepID=A0A0F9CT11_9ZZZZ
MPRLEFTESEKAILSDLAEGDKPAFADNINREYGNLPLNSLIKSGYVSLAGTRIFLTDKGNRALEGNLRGLEEGFV